MVVPDSLSRTSKFPTTVNESPDEDDPFFHYANEPPSSITMSNGQTLASLLTNELCSNFLDVHNVYDADTEDNIDHPIHHMKTLGKGHSYSTQSLISSVNDQPSKYSDIEITPQDISPCNAPSSHMNNQDD